MLKLNVSKYCNRPSKWKQWLGQNMSDLLFNFKSCYAPPNILRDGDLSWRMMHGVVATGKLFCILKVRQDESCPFCSGHDDLMHIFNECPRLLPLFTLIDYFVVGIFPDMDSCGVLVVFPRYMDLHLM